MNHLYYERYRYKNGKMVSMDRTESGVSMYFREISLDTKLEHHCFLRVFYYYLPNP